MAQQDIDVRVFNTSNNMTNFLVRKWRETAEDAVARKGFFAAALSGGATPADFYCGLANLNDVFLWGRTHVFLVDERFVPKDDRDSNYGMMQTLFLQAVGIPKENVHAVMTNEPSAAKAAARYEKDLKRFFGLTGAALPGFDFMGLGVGEDGHTASLFPEDWAVRERGRLVVAVGHNGVKHQRVSLTLPVINKAKHIIFIVTGKHKAAIVKRVIEDRDKTLYAAMVDPMEGDLVFALDADAASLLSGRM